MRLLALVLIAVFGLLATGCRTLEVPGKPPEPPALTARFHLEAVGLEPGIEMVLPRSGVALSVSPKPVVVESDIVNVELAEVEMGQCLMFQLNGAAARDLYRLSVMSIGRRLVLVLDDNCVGARPIEAAMADGVILTFVEVADEELPALVERLKVACAALAAAKVEAK